MEITKELRIEIQSYIDSNPVVVDIENATEDMAEEYLDDQCGFESETWDGYIDWLGQISGEYFREMAKMFFEDEDEEEAIDAMRDADLYPDVSLSFDSVLDCMVKRHIILFSNSDCMNSHWFESQGGYDYEYGGYFTDVVDFLQLDPGSLYHILDKRGFNISACPWKLLFNRDPMVDVESFAQELENSCGSANLWVIPVLVQARDLARGVPKSIKVYKGATCGLFDSWSGSGSLLECKFIRDVVIQLGQYGETEYDKVELRRPSGYTPMDVYGSDSIYNEADILEWEDRSDG